MRRYAAAVVLAELAPKDGAVVKALGEALGSANPMLVTAILGAFEAIGSNGAVPYVLQLLDAPEMENKLRAAAIVAKGGAAIVPEVRDRLAKAGPAQKLLLVDLLSRIHTRDAFEAVLDLLFEPDFELVKGVCEAVRRHIDEVVPKERLQLHKSVVAFMTSAKVKDQERVLTSCLLLLGSIGRPEAREILLKYADPGKSLYLRRHALIGLKHVEIPKAAGAALARTMLPILDDPDEGLAKHALDILARVGGPAPWGKLIEGRHGAIRVFAARKLAEDDSASTNRMLLGLLAHRDIGVQESAASGLAGHKGSTPILLGALAAEKNPEAAWRLAKILKPHSERLAGKALKTLASLAARELKAGSPKYEPLLYAIRNADPKAADAVLKEAGLVYRKAGEWAKAVECLRKLINTETFDDEIRYALSACNLKLSLKNLTLAARGEDHALRGFQGLIRNKEFGLFARLKKDKSLDAPDLYYLGFHFIEMWGDEKAFGEQILQHLAKTKPRSEEGRAAKNKLKLAKTG